MTGIRTLLIANRGEIVSRIARTARALGIRTAAVFSDADRDSPALAAVEVAVRLPGVTAAETYLDQEAILAAAATVGADAIHPGFGFLAENAGFAAAVGAAGHIWVGPTPDQMAAMGDKVAARAVAAAAGVPVLPAGPAEAAASIGYPLLVKAAAGGGGKGMRVVAAPGDLGAALTAAAGEAKRSFGDGSVYLERYVDPARHLEVQIVGDGSGDVVHLFERECSIQRRHQKVIEEAPSPGIDEATRHALCTAAVALGQHMSYLGAGTVEFVVAGASFWFIEMNTRLQVEHPVTEEVTGVDLVEWQLRIASGEPIPVPQEEIVVSGHAIEARLYAEEPRQGWAPSVGSFSCYRHGPGHARYEDAVVDGSIVTPHYDPMLAKVIGTASTRGEAAAVLAAELEAMVLHGPATNRDFLVAALRSDAFSAGETYTRFIDDHPALTSPELAPAIRRIHLAAALWERSRRHRANDVHWGFAPSGWRNVPSQPQHVDLAGSLVSYRVGVDRLEVTVDEEAFSAEVWGEGPYLVSADGLTMSCAVDVHGDTWWVNGGGQSSFVERPRFALHDSVLGGGGPTAPVPGTVVAVLVTPGDEVDDGTDLLVMEAMKMEHRIRASGPATVVDVLVAPGDQVDAGRLLVRLEERSA